MVATKVNSFIASLDPSDQKRDLGAFLHEACNALRLPSDAELARAMMVSPATLASWKRRGKIPVEQVRWFQSIFPTLVFNRWRSSVPPYPASTIELVLLAVHQFYADNLSDRVVVRKAALAFGGLAAFVPLIASTYFDFASDEAVFIADDVIVERLVAALEWCEAQEL